MGKRLVSYNRACQSCGEDDPLTVKVRVAKRWLCGDCRHEYREQMRADPSIQVAHAADDCVPGCPFHTFTGQGVRIDA